MEQMCSWGTGFPMGIVWWACRRDRRKKGSRKVQDMMKEALVLWEKSWEEKIEADWPCGEQLLAKRRLTAGVDGMVSYLWRLQCLENPDFEFFVVEWDYVKDGWSYCEFLFLIERPCRLWFWLVSKITYLSKSLWEISWFATKLTWQLGGKEMLLT